MNLSQDYNISEVDIIDVKQEEYGRMNFLSITFTNSIFHQGYPVCNTKNGYAEQFQHLCETFEITKTSQLIKKKCIAMHSNSDTFFLFNPDNNQFFSLQAKFFPEEYKDVVQNYSEIDSKILSLDSFDALLLAALKIQKTQDPIKEYLEKILETKKLNLQLQHELKPHLSSKNLKI
jgi:hypothetical protein